MNLSGVRKALNKALDKIDRDQENRSPRWVHYPLQSEDRAKISLALRSVPEIVEIDGQMATYSQGASRTSYDSLAGSLWMGVINWEINYILNRLREFLRERKSTFRNAYLLGEVSVSRKYEIADGISIRPFDKESAEDRRMVVLDIGYCP